MRLRAELSEQTFRKKLSGAYGGAVRTHRLGFPARVPATPTTAEDTVPP